MRRAFVKIVAVITLIAVGLGIITGCTAVEKDESEEQTEDETEEQKRVLNLKIDESKTYQTIESFGASGAWWSQVVGGWSEESEENISYRDKIATLLYDREKGIGLTNYRYNIGAGSADSADMGINDVWRRAESFLNADGSYDWTKDENAVWMMKKAYELGVEEIVFFCNSPPESLTLNGHAYGEKKEGVATTSNLPKENYKAYADYVLDIVEHFKNEGYPIKFVSPVNEPQWEWTGGQEGCHYEPEEVVELLNVFLDEMEERKIPDLELAAPELGEWGNTSYKYLEAIFADERLKSELKMLDMHSYWTQTDTKVKFEEWLTKQGITDVKLRMSEWCEMVNGRDTGMDSAIVLSETVTEDLNTLSVTSWQYWIAVSCYNYRDGLIYVNKVNKRINETKRLWALGNYSRFIRPGYVRTEMETSTSSVKGTAFLSKEKDNLVVVLTNTMPMEYKVDMTCFGEYKVGSVYVTDEEHSLEKTAEITTDTSSLVIPSTSVTTITLTK